MNWFQRNYNAIIRTSYIIPILLVAAISVSHVIDWYGLTNPASWAVYLSIAIEIAALGALAGMNVKNVTKFVYVPFIIVTLIQLVGNIFFAFKYSGANPERLSEWIQLINPLFESIGLVDGTDDIMGHRRALAYIGGGLLPLISLSFMELLVRFNKKLGETEEPKPVTIEHVDEVESIQNEKVDIKEPEVFEVESESEPESEVEFESESSEEPVPEVKTEPEVEVKTEPEVKPVAEKSNTSNDIAYENIKEIKEKRGFTTNIPRHKDKSVISRIGDNKVIDSSNPSTIVYKRGDK